MLQCSTALLGSSNMYILIFLAMQTAISVFFYAFACWTHSNVCILISPALCRLQWPWWYLVPACQGCRPCSWLGELYILWRRGGGFDGFALAQGCPQCATRSRLPPRGLQFHRDETSRASRSRFHWWTHSAGCSGFRCWTCAGMLNWRSSYCNGRKSFLFKYADCDCCSMAAISKESSYSG